MAKLINTGKPVYLGDSKKFVLTEDWKYTNENYCFSTQTLIVPKGFICDLASIPSWIWWLQWGKWNLAAVLHDYCYATGSLSIECKGKLHHIKCNKLKADVLFFQVCLALGVNPLIAFLMFVAVILFGKFEPSTNNLL